MAEAPTGLITFLFTDIEGSTRLWEHFPAEMQTALVRHEAILQENISKAGGYIFKTIGDAFCVAFQEAEAAINAALQTQLALLSEKWPAAMGELRVRMGLYTGPAQARDGDYFGQSLNRVARLMSVAHGHQILAARSTLDALPPDKFQFRDLGLHRLKDLLQPEQLFQLEAPGLPSSFPPLRSLSERRHNLPMQMTNFIGREREIAEVRGLLAKPDVRLLMLTGPGGTGKTRLSLQVAAELLEQFSDGAWFIELAPLSDPELTITAFASGLNLPEDTSQRLLNTVLNYLCDKNCLLVLDNCEHLISATAEISEQILQKCPNVKILATSREAFNIAGENVWRVPSLKMPGPEIPIPFEELGRYEAVRLFVDRAHLVKPDFVPTPENAPALIQICRRLDGIPLALEMAAARLRVMSIEQIAGRLDNIFKLLTGGNRTALPRQQTLRALIDWSYDLLNTEEKSLFGRLAVFAGSWSLEAAEALADDLVPDPFETLLQLVNKSLATFDEVNGENRYRMLETIRQYATEKLSQFGELEEARRQQAEYFLNFAAENSPRLRQSDQYYWLTRFQTEHDNFRVALAWLLEQKQLVAAATMCHNLLPFWATRGHVREAWHWYNQVLTLNEDTKDTSAILPPALLAKTLCWYGWLHTLKTEPDKARPLIEKAIELAREVGEKSVVAHALLLMQHIYFQAGELEAVKQVIEEALQIFQELGDRWGYAQGLQDYGWLVQGQVNVAASYTYFKQAEAIFRELGDWSQAAGALGSYAWAKRSQGELEEAKAAFAEAIELRRKEGNISALAFLINGMGATLDALADYDAAERCFLESLSLRREINDLQNVSNTLNNLASLAMYRGDFKRSIALYQEALAIVRRKERGFINNYALLICNLANVLILDGQLEEASRMAEESLILRREIGHKVGLIHALGVVGWTRLEQNNLEDSEASLLEALRLGQETNEQLLTPLAVDILIKLHSLRGNYETAARLYGATQAWSAAKGMLPSPETAFMLKPVVAMLQAKLGSACYETLVEEGLSLNSQQTLAFALGEPLDFSAIVQTKVMTTPSSKGLSN